MNKRLKIIKLLILIRYLYERKKAARLRAWGCSACDAPIGTSGGLNLYRAFGNNPVNSTDPWGLFIDAPLPGGTYYNYNNKNPGINGLTWGGRNVIENDYEYYPFLWDVIKYTATDTFKMITSPCFYGCVAKCMMLPTEAQVGETALEKFLYNRTDFLYSKNVIGKKALKTVELGLNYSSKTTLAFYLLYFDYCTYKCVKEYFND